MKANEIIPALWKGSQFRAQMWIDGPVILYEEQFLCANYDSERSACIGVARKVKRWLSDKEGLLWVRIEPESGRGAEPSKWSAYCKLAIVEDNEANFHGRDTHLHLAPWERKRLLERLKRRWEIAA